MSGYIGVLARRQMRWDTYLAKDPEIIEMNRTLKRFIRKGVPLRYRKLVWFKTSGAWAAQRAEPNLYADLLRMNHDTEIAEAIKIDLPRTFPNNIFFGSIQSQLYNILIGYSNYDRRVGYCQGLNYIAGLLLLVCKDEEVTFWLLKHFLQEVTKDYHIKSMSGLIKDIGVMVQLIRINVPEVYEHVRRIGLSWTVILTKWFICIYAEVLPTETVLRVWDCIFSEGHKVCYRYTFSLFPSLIIILVSFQIIFRVALTMIVLFRKEIVNTEDILDLSNVFKGIVSSDLITDCHAFLKIVYETTNKTVRRAEIERLRGIVGNTALD